MKNYLTIFLLFIAIGLFSQEVFYIHTVNIPQENQEHFEKIMTDYVTELAQDEISKGDIKAWYLMKRVPNIGEIDSDEPNYLWIHVFDSYEDMTAGNQWWNNSKEKYGIDPSILYSGFNGTTGGFYYWQTEKAIESDVKAQYLILNFARPKDLNSVMEVNQDVEKHFKKNLVKSGMTGWGYATRIAPQNSTNGTIMFWDVYDNLTNVMKHMAGGAALEGLDQSLFKKFEEANPDGWLNRLILEYVTGTTD